MSHLTFSVRGIEFEDRDGLLSLTTIFKLAGSPKNLEPSNWRRFPSVIELCEQIASELNVCPTQLFHTTKGRGGGTWAHWKLALFYASSLDPALHSDILETYRRVKSGDLSVAAETVKRNYDPNALEAFQKDVEQHAKYIDSYWGVHAQLKAHGANDGRQHGAYNAHVNKLAGLPNGKRHEADRRQLLTMRIAQDAGELGLMDSDAQGWSAVQVAKDAGTNVVRALPGRNQ